MTPEKNYEFAYEYGYAFPGCQKIACQEPEWAYLFARDIPEADIGYCQKYACKWCEWKGFRWAGSFARNIPNANIQYCQKHACKDEDLAYWFARNIPEADIEYCYKYAHEGGKKSLSELILKFL